MKLCCALLSFLLSGWQDAAVSIDAHDNLVSDVAYSPDGQLILSVSWDGRIGIWKSKDGKAVRDISPGYFITSVSVSADGNKIASGANDRAIRVFQAEDGKQIRQLGGHTGLVLCVTFSHRGDRIASACDRGELRVWDCMTGESLIAVKIRGPITSVEFSPDDRLLVTGGWDKTARIWSAETGEQLRTLEGHEGAVIEVAFSPDGRKIATANSDRTVKLWSAETGQELHTYEGHTGSVQCVDFSPDGRWLVSGDADGIIRIWSVEGGAMERDDVERTLDVGSKVYSVEFSSDSKRILSGDEQGFVKVWNVVE